MTLSIATLTGKFIIRQAWSRSAHLGGATWRLPVVAPERVEFAEHRDDFADLQEDHVPEAGEVLSGGLKAVPFGLVLKQDGPL